MDSVTLTQIPQKAERAVSLKNRNRRFDGEKIFKGLLVFLSSLVILILAAIFAEMIRSSRLSLKTFGWSFITGKTWDPVKEVFGALPFIYGTLVTSFLAMLIAVPVSLGISLFLTEWAPAWVRRVLSFLVELLAAIPSVIYGLWGIFVLIPFLRDHVFPLVNKWLGFLPFFEGPFYGASVLAGGLILSIMILPTIASVSKEVFLSVPNELREAVLALGGTRWESIRLAVLKMSRSGLIGAVALGLGRAIGETMAVTMVIGNRSEIVASIFSPGYSLASVIANEFSEATTPLYLSALSEIGLLLLAVTFLVNALARVLVKVKR
ncbi:MAG: phosphate ABC transporter permease subunit PstC [bacterium]